MQTLEERLTGALADGDHATAAALLRAAFGRGDEQTLPELLEELAEYYATLGRFDDAVSAMTRALEVGWEGRPDGRCRIGEFLLRAGMQEEARAVFAEVRADHPDDVLAYYAIGEEYAEADDHEAAARWLGDGLQAWLRAPEHTREVIGVVAQTLALRRSSLDALGQDGPDDLEEQVAARLRGLRAGEPAAQPDAEDASSDEPGEVFAYPWLPREEFEAAQRAWPAFGAEWRGRSYAEYCREIESHLRALSALSPARRVALAPLRVEAVEQWASQRGIDPGEPVARDACAAAVAQAGGVRPWPPEDADPCWCGGELPYDPCCGAGTP